MKRDLLNEEVDQIINQSFWQKSGFKITDPQSISENTEGEYTEEQTADQEGHVCPLCEHIISEPISDDQLAEHIEAMLAIISEVHDISDEDLAAIEEAIQDEMTGDSDDEDSDDDSDEDSDDDSDEVDG